MRLWVGGWVAGIATNTCAHKDYSCLFATLIIFLPSHRHIVSLSLSLSIYLSHTLPIYFSHSHALSLSHSFTLSHTQTTKHYLSLSHSFSLILSVSLSSSHIQTLPTYIFHKHTHKQCPSLSHSFTCFGVTFFRLTRKSKFPGMKRQLSSQLEIQFCRSVATNFFTIKNLRIVIIIHSGQMLKKLPVITPKVL